MEFKAFDIVLQTIIPSNRRGHLENVIFVHQDEANWPLPDPSTLKEKIKFADMRFCASRFGRVFLKIKKKHNCWRSRMQELGQKHARRDAKMHYSEVNHQRKICGNQILMKTAVRSTSFRQQQ
ncbi:unnamed protein product [Prunus armeniaca]|uniref:Uncharacterized protein n=1 Tax=Prunus armeniaca TaxID=36596 RepID=A0A6J5TJD9_PRUAR|nr:unnamed protein product [Prunus armeniaca]CAB4294218.1 unnamed protein product [Prunus armeniaca]